MKLITPFTILNQNFRDMDLIREAIKTEDQRPKDCTKIIERCITTTSLLIDLKGTR